MSKTYTPAQVAVKILQKAEELTKSAMAGLKPTVPAAVPGVVSPMASNTASPMKVGSQAVVKAPKAKKPGQSGDKPSLFFKNEDFKNIKKSSIGNLKDFLENQRKKKRL